MNDDTELFKQFSDDPDFKRWLADTGFGMTYDATADPCPQKCTAFDQVGAYETDRADWAGEDSWPMAALGAGEDVTEIQIMDVARARFPRMTESLCLPVANGSFNSGSNAGSARPCS